MIGKIIIGDTFGPCISYVLEGSKADKAERNTTGIEKATVLNYNFCYGDKKELITQFNDVRALNPKMKRAVAHIIISFSPQDNVSNNQMIEISQKLGLKMGFNKKNQYLVVKHNDTPTHNHLHIVCNRVSFEGKTLSDSNNYKTISEFCREMEKEYNLEKVLSPNRFLPKEQRNYDRKDARVENCKKTIENCLKSATSWDDLCYKLMPEGISFQKGRGLFFVDDKGVKVKASSISLSISQIEQKFNQNIHIEKVIGIDNRNRSTNTEFSSSESENQFQRIKTLINQSLHKSTSWDEFSNELAKSNVDLEKARGLAFIDGASRIKASSIGFSKDGIEDLFLEKISALKELKSSPAKKADFGLSINSTSSILESKESELIEDNKIDLEKNISEVHRTNIVPPQNQIIEQKQVMGQSSSEIRKALLISNDWAEFKENLASKDIKFKIEDQKVVFHDNNSIQNLLPPIVYDYGEIEAHFLSHKQNNKAFKI
jgi:hypothetical protein